MTFTELWKSRFRLKHLMVEEDGQDLVEYGLAILLVSTALVTAMSSLAGDIAAMYTNIANAFPSS
jgi:Flp pilus assembly pilin Flp